MNWTEVEATAQVRLVHTDYSMFLCLGLSKQGKYIQVQKKHSTRVKISAFIFCDPSSCFCIGQKIESDHLYIKNVLFLSQISMNVQTRPSALMECALISLEATIVTAHQTLNSIPLEWAV